MTMKDCLDSQISAENILSYSKKEIKSVEGTHRKCELPIPQAINNADGISVYGRLLKSFVFSCDPYIIRNTNADAILAVSPFTCQLPITQMLIQISERPVFVGVAGRLTYGKRSVDLACAVEAQGAQGVVVSPGCDAFTIEQIRNAIDIPLIVSVCDTDYASMEKIEAGASIVNVAAGSSTTKVLRKLKLLQEDIPVIATGGGNSKTINSTILAGADAISWTAPSLTELEKVVMAQNRIKPQTA